MKESGYVYRLDPSPDDVLYIRFVKERGRILNFSIQYVALIGGTWHEIMRIDTAHGYAHKHIFHLNSDERIVNLTLPGERLNEQFTESEELVRNNYRMIKQNYLNT